MYARILKWTTATLFVIMFAAPAFAQSTVEVICRCVEDGVNAEMVQWLQEDVFPAFEARMEEQGQEVTAVYHSHVGAAAYFSEMDQAFATQPGFPFPKADHLVVSVLGHRVHEVAIFRPGPDGALIGCRVESISP